MNSNEMKVMALCMTGEDETVKIRYRDLFYDPVKKLFLHQAVKVNRQSGSKSAATIINGSPSQGWLNQACYLVGRYEIDVNPMWILDDMRNV